MNTTGSQFKILFKRNSFVITLLCSYIFSISVFVLNCFKQFGKDIVLVPAAKYLALGTNIGSGDLSASILYNVIAALAIIPFADTYFEERQNGTFQYCTIRMGDKSYYFSKLFTVFFSGFFVIFSTLILNHLLNFIAFPYESTLVFSIQTYKDNHLFDDSIYHMLFPNLFIKNTYLYNLLLALLASLAAGFMAVLVFQISFFYKKNRIVLICSAFIGYVFLDIVIASICGTEFCLGNYLLPGRYYCDQSIRGLIVTFSALIAASLLPTSFAVRRMRNSYD